MDFYGSNGPTNSVKALKEERSGKAPQAPPEGLMQDGALGDRGVHIIFK